MTASLAAGVMPDIEAFKDLARGLVIGKLPLALTDIISIHLYMDSVFVRKVQGKEHMRMCMRAHTHVIVHVCTVAGRIREDLSDVRTSVSIHACTHGSTLIPRSLACVPPIHNSHKTNCSTLPRSIGRPCINYSQILSTVTCELVRWLGKWTDAMNSRVDKAYHGMSCLRRCQPSMHL